MGKAQQAKNENDIGVMKDSASLLATNYIQEYMDKRYVQMLDGFATTYTNAGAYAKAQFQNATEGGYTYEVLGDTLTVSDSKDNSVSGTILDNGNIEWNSTGNSNNNGNNNNNQGGGDTGNVTIVSETDTVKTISVTSFANLNTDASLPSTKNIVAQKGTGTTQQQIVIPSGFIVASDSGKTLEAGMVIEDASEDENGNPTTRTGNQFVWIPVNQVVTYSDVYNASVLKTTLGENTTSGIITLGRYSFGTEDEPRIERAVKENGSDDGSIVIDSYYTETVSNSVARDISDFRSKTEETKGYYIGRYEMGKDNGKWNNKKKTWVKIDTTKEMKTVCKAEEPVHNYTSRGRITTTDGTTTLSGAIKESRELYGIVTKETEQGIMNLYASDLVNSYAWDTAIVFIEKCGTNPNSSTYAWQKSLTSSGPLSTGTSSDGTNNDKQCNIFDMAGNLIEYTTEYSSREQAGVAVKRGDYYNGPSYCYTNYRGSDSETVKGAEVGFRPIIYILET